MPNAAHILDRHSHRKRASDPVTLLKDLAFERARVHEICGPARRRLAVMTAGEMTGGIMWITPAWMPGRLNPDGFHKIAAPKRFLFLTPKRPEDLLWSMEAALRSGLVPLVVAELPDPPGLTAVRRLHLAAESGAKEGRVAPLGLLLTPGDGGAPGVETRWSLAPTHGDQGQTSWTLDRRRARMQPEKSWKISATSAGLHLKAPAAQADHTKI